MTGARASAADDGSSETYEIRVKGHLDRRWAGQLGGLALTLESGGITNLKGPLADQAALHGVLNRIRDLGIAIISVQSIGSGQQEEEEGENTDDRS